jgi:FkbM family methyltransferase
MKLYYGIVDNLVEVTEICLSKLSKNNIITIPYGDGNRANYFSDHLWGVLKKIFIYNDNGSLTEYDDFTQIQINILDNTIFAKNINEYLTNIHSNLKINYGTFNEELPEQKMVVRYLTGSEKVLEIGGNIGRNSLVIASILENSENLVTLECDVNIAKQLTENRNLNNLHFHIECSALSDRKLIQNGWNTMPSETLLPEYNWVNTITLEGLKSKYNIEFDTLVLDCEGAFYYILMDMPEILNNIKLIIMENDYQDISNKNYVDDVLIKNDFVKDYTEMGGWGGCYDNFFEVWKKTYNI